MVGGYGAEGCPEFRVRLFYRLWPTTLTHEQVPGCDSCHLFLGPEEQMLVTLHSRARWLLVLHCMSFSVRDFILSLFHLRKIKFHYRIFIGVYNGVGSCETLHLLLSHSCWHILSHNPFSVRMSNNCQCKNHTQLTLKAISDSLFRRYFEDPWPGNTDLGYPKFHVPT